MELVIDNEKNIDISSYVFHWVLPAMKEYIRTGLSLKKLENYSEAGTS